MILNDKDIPYSFSQNRLYGDCPRKYKYRYIDGIKEPTNENLELGSAVHKVFELFWAQYCPKDEPIEEYTTALKTIEKYKGAIYLRHLLTEFSELSAGKPDFNLAREFKIERDDFVSVIDLVHNYAPAPHNYVLADYKVTKKPKQELTMYTEGQLLVYKYFFCKEHPEVNPDDVLVQYINIYPYLTNQILNPTKTVNISLSTCENLIESMMKTKDNILRGDFPKKKTWCNWCFYRDICETDHNI